MYNISELHTYKTNVFHQIFTIGTLGYIHTLFKHNLLLVRNISTVCEVFEKAETGMVVKMRNAVSQKNCAHFCILCNVLCDRLALAIDRGALRDSSPLESKTQSNTPLNSDHSPHGTPGTFS